MKLYRLFCLGGVFPAALSAAAALTPANTQPRQPATITAPVAPAPEAPPASPAAESVPVAAKAELAVAPTAPSAWSTPVPFNFARSVTGAGIVVTSSGGVTRTLTFADRDQSPYSALLGVDSTVGAPLAAGRNEIVVDLGPLAANIAVQFAGFFSRTCAGTVEVFYAPDVARPLGPQDRRWRSTKAAASFAANEFVRLPFAPVLSRYVLLSFNVTTPGEINSLAIFGPPSTDLAVVPTPNQPGVNGEPPSSNTNMKMTEFDFAPAIYGSRVAYVGGTSSTNVQSVLDGDPQSGVELGEGGLDDNIMIVDLGSTKEVNKFGMLFKPTGAGKFEIYMLNKLPEGLEVNNPRDALAAPATTATPPAAAPTAVLWPQADGRRAPLLLAAAAGSLAEALALHQLGALAVDVQSAQIPASFFTETSPNAIQNIEIDQDKVSLKFEKLPCRFLLIRWVPADPNSSGINVFEINLIGDVPEEELPRLIAELAPIFDSPSGPEAPDSGSTPTPTPPPDEGLTPDPPPIPPPVSP